MLGSNAQQSGILVELEEIYDGQSDGGHQREGTPTWTNSDGDRLWDYGVDEDVELVQAQHHLVPVDADEDVPIAELIRRRRVLTKSEN